MVNTIIQTGEHMTKLHLLMSLSLCITCHQLSTVKVILCTFQSITEVEDLCQSDMFQNIIPKPYVPLPGEVEIIS